MLFASQQRLTLEQLVNSIHHQADQRTKIRYEMLDEILFEAEDANIIDKLKIANNFVNKANYLLDIDHWKKVDYWATPHEFLRTAAGDSEDFALMKYYVLTLMGISKDQLKIMIYDKPNPVLLRKKNHYVRDYEHIVLAYYHTSDSNPLILEAKNSNIHKEINRNLLTDMSYEPVKNTETIDLYKRFESSPLQEELDEVNTFIGFDTTYEQ